MLTRRGLITGLISLAAAPAIVRYSNLMPVKVIEPVITLEEYTEKILIPMLDDYYNQHMADSFAYMLQAKNDIIKITGISEFEFYKGSQW